MESSRDDFIIAIRSALLKKGAQQRFSLLGLIFFSIIFLILGSFNFKVIDYIKIDKKTKVSKENFCLVLFFKKAERIAIIKSSLLEDIFFSIQST